MPASQQDKAYVNYIVELMQPAGPVEARAMFGGFGIFLEGLMFALVADGELFFKADDDSADRFTAKNLPAFTYQKKGRQYAMSYYQAPEEVMEDSEQMHTWVTLAYDAALRAAAKKKK